MTKLFSEKRKLSAEHCSVNQYISSTKTVQIETLSALLRNTHVMRNEILHIHEKIDYTNDDVTAVHIIEIAQNKNNKHL